MKDSLDERRAALRGRIALQRVECALATADIARPLRWIDRSIALWRALPPAARIALIGALATAVRPVSRGPSRIRRILTWLPAVTSLIRFMRSARRTPGS